MKHLKRFDEDSKFSVEPNIKKRPREKDIDSIFGQKYSYYVPDDVIRYMRKSPKRIIERLVRIYGEEQVRKYVDMAVEPKKSDMMPADDISRDGYDNE